MKLDAEIIPRSAQSRKAACAKLDASKQSSNKEASSHVDPKLAMARMDRTIRIDMRSLNKALPMSKLPKRLTISTMTMTCCIGTKINRKNVAYYIELTEGGIDNIRFGSNPGYQRSLTVPKKTKTNSKRFYNQTTIEIDPGSGSKPINVKLFRNGSLQMTGVKNVDDFVAIMGKLFYEFRRVKSVVLDGSIRPKPFVTNLANLRVFNIKVDLINTNFRANCEFDRIKLHRRLLAEDIRSTYQPCMHSAVNIKYYYSEGELDDDGETVKKKVSIFVFESGAFIITGGGCIDHIQATYQFIVDKVNEYGHEIVLIKTEHILSVSKKLQQFMRKLPDPFKQKRLGLP
jgi:TATA-box binding protein (TBP) (component of TFIID and TFIIIB)